MLKTPAVSTFPPCKTKLRFRLLGSASIVKVSVSAVKFATSTTAVLNNLNELPEKVKLFRVKFTAVEDLKLPTSE